ncbi:MAG: hypothetical protein GVY28_01715 [Alphaproteobacteria bacterium]|jgi:hypothetical protein|nr:hypothetical protein [Alphaproteobacteria bacterium]
MAKLRDPHAITRRTALTLCSAVTAALSLGHSPVPADRERTIAIGDRHVVHRGWVLKADDLADLDRR